MEKNLAGRNAVVTGAAMGIGRATAEVLAERGAKVIALDYNESKLTEMIPIWKSAGLDITPMQCDVTSAEAVSSVFKKIGEIFPKLSILANIAGVVRYGKIVVLSEADWDYQLDTAKAGADGYVMASQVRINGVVFDSVGRSKSVV